ncbi:DUF4365 domain-containing protein [Coleofasciculus chthonoplastes]|uniref:DUF4365 domain-containing protein n=1 Tax=Coleofasciculus TaxID=669368 RepID=UPI0032F8F9F5
MVQLKSSNEKKEEFSYAYIHAVASVAGYAVEKKRRMMDNSGIDLTIETPGEIGEILYPKFDVQVKCTSADILRNDFLSFPLEVKNYNKLIHPRPLVPQVLIVVVVPKSIEKWINISEEETLMKKCGYWTSLKNRPSTQNTETITVKIPRMNLFTPSSLNEIMKKISMGEDL